MPLNMLEEQVQEGRSQFMPVFMGSPWAQKFGGQGSDVNFEDWVSQIEYLVSVQRLSEPQQIQFILGSLEGEAKREVLAVGEASRNTTKKIFELLSSLYGDNTPVAALRAKFFNCRQGPKQTVRSFCLHLRELFSRLRSRGDSGLGDTDTLLRDQFIMGLRDGPIRQQLKLQLRRDPRLTFEAVRKEALALEADKIDQDDPPACMAVTGTGPAAVSPATDWKQQLRAEILKEVKEQMVEFSKTIRDELLNRPAPVARLSRERSYSEGPANDHRPHTRTANSSTRFQWDAQGRPICTKCGEAGHIGRYCHPRRASQGDF